MSNIETTKAIVAAFLRGDVQGVLAHVADDVEWEYGSINDVPWYRARHGKAEVADFFASLAAVEFSQWEPKQYLGEGDLAIVVIDSDYLVKGTGRRVVYEDCLLLFRFDAEGKVARFGHRTDLLAGWLAYHDRPIA
jgi:ketosteroid isomerase-like protein